MKKWLRNYRMTIQNDGESPVVIEYPLTLELAITRGNYSMSGQATFRIYNLSAVTRGKVYRNFNDMPKFMSIKLEAGYGKSLGTVFDGNVIWARSYRREGQTNYITEINAFDYGFVKSMSDSAWSVEGDGASKDAVIRRLCSDLKRPVSGVMTAIPIGAIGEFDKTSRSRYQAAGNTWALLTTETEGRCFIDQGKVYCLSDNEAYQGTVTEISNKTGLLGTPTIDGVMMSAEMVFEPGIQVGQVVNLISDAATQQGRDYSGYRKVIGIEHRGTISGSVSGKLTTRVTMAIGSASTADPFSIVTQG